MKVKRTTELAWGMYDEAGNLRGTAPNRNLGRQVSRENNLNLVRVKITTTPVK